LLLAALGCPPEMGAAPDNFSASYQLEARSGGRVYAAQLVLVAEPPQRLRLELVHMAQTRAVMVLAAGRLQVANFERREWIDVPATPASSQALLGFPAAVPEILFALSGEAAFLAANCRPDGAACACDDGGAGRVYRFARTEEGGWARWYELGKGELQPLLSADYARLRERNGSLWPERIGISIAEPEVSLRLELLDLKLDRTEIDPNLFELHPSPNLVPVPWAKVEQQAPYLWR
jgi:hypothetical protein